jgi:GDP-mannose pyrophosphatase NudK
MKDIEIVQRNVIVKGWSTLEKFTVAYTDKHNQRTSHELEAYQRGDGCCVFLYNPATKKVILTQQFRIPTYINGNPTGFLIEVCAGKLDVADPAVCIRREILEETGYQVPEVQQVMVAYSTPGSVSEKCYYFVAAYNEQMKVSEGGGLEEEQEELDVLEMPFTEAVRLLNAGEIRDAKTILLLQYALIHRLVD